MDERKYKRAYHTQKGHAKLRGIEWQFTYETWREWWGDDIDRRGVRPLDLQMQRIMDAGPYAPGNVRKGRPRDNAVTRAVVHYSNAWRKVVEAERAEFVVHEDEDDRPDSFEHGLGYARPAYWV